MLCLLYLASLVSLIHAGCPNGGSFSTNDAGVCVFDCYDSTTEITQDDLTFEEIKTECRNVRNAARFGDCSSKEQLRWSSYCQCPYCACDTASEGTPYSWEKAIEKTCYDCKCAAHSYSSYGYGDQLLFQCDERFDADEPYNWEDFECPTGSWDSYNSYCEDGTDRYYPGQYWFANVAADAKCNKFCYCAAGGVAECKTGFDSIVNEGSDKLKAAFFDECGYESRSCWSTPELLFTTDMGPTCSNYNCPDCHCPDGEAVGTTYTVTHQGEFGWNANYQDAITCAQCTCQGSVDATVASCSYDDQYPETNEYEYSCPGPQTLSCHEAWGENGPTLGTQNFEERSYNHPEGWCSIDLEVEEDDDDDWDWGHDTLFCSIYGSNDECFYYTWARSYENCYGDTITDSDTTYTWCCNTDNCNYVAGDTKIDTDTCTESPKLNALFSELYECARELEEDDCDDVQETVTCASIRSVYEVQARCYCEAYKNLYDDANGLWKPWIKTQIDMFMTGFTDWNQVLGCPGELKCDLTRDDGVITFSAAEYNCKVYVALALGFVSLVSLL